MYLQVWTSATAAHDEQVVVERWGLCIGPPPEKGSTGTVFLLTEDDSEQPFQPSEDVPKSEPANEAKSSGDTDESSTHVGSDQRDHRHLFDKLHRVVSTESGEARPKLASEEKGILATSDASGIPRKVAEDPEQCSIQEEPNHACDETTPARPRSSRSEHSEDALSEQPSDDRETPEPDATDAEEEEQETSRLLSRINQLLTDLAHAQPPRTSPPPTPPPEAADTEQTKQPRASQKSKRASTRTAEATTYAYKIGSRRSLQGVATGSRTEPLARLLIGRIIRGRSSTMRSIIHDSCPSESTTLWSSEDWTKACLDRIRSKNLTARKRDKILERNVVPDTREIDCWVAYAVARAAMGWPRAFGERVDVFDAGRGWRGVW